MMRGEARQLLMQLLFQMEIQKDYGTELKTRFFEGQTALKKQREYIDSLFLNITEHLTEIDAILEQCASGWKVSRMNKVDLAIARISAAEILYREDIPDAVSVNEAVELAKKFGTDESGRFVNGLLGQVIKEKHAR